LLLLRGAKKIFHPQHSIMVAAPSRPFHWPGGIPNEIQVDANGDITPEQANEEAKGWLLFVEVSHSAPDFACFSR
jgi:hypothetical protein